MRKFWVMAAVTLVAIAAAAKDWETDFEKASAAAKTSGKYMLLDFSGSDWCGWCMKLDKEVFKKNEFKKFAESNLVCVVVDFPRDKPQSNKQKKQNNALQDQFGVKGYPTVLLLSPDGTLVGSTGYRQGGPEPFVKNLSDMIEADKAKKKDDKPAK